MTGQRTNWAGNVTFGAQRFHRPTSVPELQQIVARSTRARAFGTGHTFNTLADTDGDLIAVAGLPRVIEIDSANDSVTASAGISYGELATALNRAGRALPNLASLPHISVAGACATGTHGSGDTNGGLATAVSAIDMVTADGDLVSVSRHTDPARFPGMVVALGALGIVTTVTLDIVQTFDIRQYVYEDLPYEQVTTHFGEIMSAAYSVSLFTDWQNKRINEVWLKHRMENGKSFDAPAEFYGAKRATKNMHPIAELSAENCTEQMGVPGPWYDRLPHFKMGFTPSAGQELQSEYFVPHKNAVDAILAVEKLHEKVGPHLFITEIRTIAADHFWMSPCHNQDSVTIHFTLKPDWPAVRQLLPVIERELAPFGARPHWGKLFTMEPAKLDSLYEKLPEFLALAKKYDPQGKFRNEFLNANVFGATS